MESEIEHNDNGIRIKASELIKKFRTKKNIYDFCRENSI